MVYVNALSYYLPEKAIDNSTIIKEYNEFVGGDKTDITPHSIFLQCGIRTRYTANMEDTAKDLGNRAAVKLFEEWNLEKASIDYLIFVSEALEYKSPPTSSVMQHNLGLEQTTATMDILQGCTGWIYGISIAKAVINAGLAKKVLLVTADLPTRVIHPEDIELRGIFSDGAAATLLSGEKLNQGLDFGIQEFVFGTDGRGENNLWVERSGTRDAADEAWLIKHRRVPSKLLGGRLRMDSPKIFLFAVRRVPQLIKAILAKNELEMEDIDLFVLHQANGTMLEFLRKRMKIPKEKFVLSLENIGNTVSSTIPIALLNHPAVRELQPGQKILVAGFGIGYSWGGTILTK